MPGKPSPKEMKELSRLVALDFQQEKGVDIGRGRHAGSAPRHVPGQLMEKAAKKGVLLSPDKVRAASSRSLAASAMEKKRQGIARAEFGAAKRYRKSSSELSKALKRARKGLGRKLPAIGAIMSGVEAYRKKKDAK